MSGFSKLALSTVILLGACGGGGPSSGGTNPGQPPPTDTVTGTVRYNGAPLAGARVLLFSTNWNRFDQIAVTDSKGVYSFSGLSTMGNAPADWLIWAMNPNFGFYPSVGSGAAVMRCGQNEFLQGYNTGGVGLDVTAIHFISLPNASLSGADFNAFNHMNAPVRLARTGQVASYAAGDDGDLHQGAAWPVARFTDNQDGTVTDRLTGLIWLKNAGTFSPTTFPLALAEVGQLASGTNGLTDGSKAGDWRLPNLCELESLVDVSTSNPALPAGNPFTNVSNGIYWSSTGYTGINWGSVTAWAVRLSDGRYINDSIANVKATSANGVWAVKGAGGGVVKLQATGLWSTFAEGDDGKVQSGVHLMYPRWIDNGDGTTTDTVTGLIWLQQANAINLPWADAVAAVNALHSGQYGLTDGSVAGSWRMPTRNEMQSLADRQQSNHADYFNNVFNFAAPYAATLGTLYQAAPFKGFATFQYYWTSTTDAADTTKAWTVFSCDFGVYDMDKAASGYTLAVR
ncbi:hypothetical protein GETHLI_23070 [Geothrix limicola]|uniref:Lcl C-terminal domain-containing protein n=1 Tax=Geothrix limicola TaxID=2927978 RepID=A0ABQ5QI05_9BACT|nr:DUF1566 domain-containing protein [Geothrix limicola]GLH73805.1 hypothetical protein GETHLI_23070 [Geothrix limicola]